MTEEQTEMLSALYAARGYLVIAGLRSHARMEIGSIVGDVSHDGVVLGQRMRVVAETTIQDFLEQQDFWGLSDRPVDYDYDKFYRVEGD